MKLTERLQQVARAEDALSQAIGADDLKVVEHELGKSISVGFYSPLFSALFDRYSLLQNARDRKSAADGTSVHDGLHTAIQFLTLRVEAKAEIREDAVQLLSTEIDEFSSPSNGEQIEIKLEQDDVERERMLDIADKMRRSLEARIAGVARLESILALPTVEPSIGALERSIQAAREVGVHERLLTKAEDKMVTARRR
uniref:Uncharacterized protein n=1 Tax=Hyaloperonospora arabidopsidis (strain Emoy2) TaxID=559515 RepID=M4B3W2_HYAAE